jgi:hypothetical protein
MQADVDISANELYSRSMEWSSDAVWNDNGGDTADLINLNISVPESHRVTEIEPLC